MFRNFKVSSTILHTPNPSQEGIKEVPSWEGIQGWVLIFKERKMDSLFLGIVLIFLVLSLAFINLCGRI